MATLEQRIAALEAKQPQSVQKVVRMFAQDNNETTEECIRRHGYDPDDEGMFFIILVPVAPAKGR